ncbi:MAG: NAD(P)/FAD-dependent oxidoreductase [Limnohabitans sp.]|nr:NAD(P)/FAD-dependent oxidoreductase [Limnohabitans sp.]
MKSYDALIVGAGAAGLFCAGVAAQLGLHILIIDHSSKVAKKIRISGGGRSNFTNRDMDVRAPHKHFLGDNPQFCRSALSKYTPADFIELVQRYGIAFHEKHKGQLFCDGSSDELIQMLLHECDNTSSGGRVDRWQPCQLKNLRFHGGDSNFYEADTDQGVVKASFVVIATGGLSIPQIGATDLGYRLAQQFGIRIVPTRPALVPLTFDGPQWSMYAELAGIALPVQIETGLGKSRITFDEDLLFTHKGLSGPAVLQISSYWKEATSMSINLSPELYIQQALLEAKQNSRKKVVSEISSWLPSRLAAVWCQSVADCQQKTIDQVSDKTLTQLAQGLSRWQLIPTGTEGYKKAEVTAGGIDTRDLSQQTMESRQLGLYFIGEVVDITGWLGGYNFQWAWASAFACAQGLAAQLKPL